MNSQNSLSQIVFLCKKFLLILCFTIILLGLRTQNVEALFVPTLSAAVGQTDLQVNGNQVINSSNSNTEIPLNLTVNTNNRTGYTVSVSSASSETALTDTISSNNSDSINSITTSLDINNFPVNTWGYRLNTASMFNPIPSLGSPENVIQTQNKTNGNENHLFNIGIKLNSNLESGHYGNSLLFSVITNPYTPTAVMTTGPRFSNLVDTLETYSMSYGQKQKKTKIEHIRRSSAPPTDGAAVINVEDETSEAEIKVWFDEVEKTLYYYAIPEKIYLNGDSSELFSEYKNLQDIDLSSFDTSLVTNMSYMFTHSPIKTLDVSRFNTKNVTDMRRMFGGLRITQLELGNFDTSNVTNMSGMFGGCVYLTTLDLSAFDTMNVTDMSNMFSNMYELKHVNLISFNTEKVTDMEGMFNEDKKIEHLDLSSFKTPQLKNISRMFYQTHALKTINMSNFKMQKVEDMREWLSVVAYVHTPASPDSPESWEDACFETNDNLMTIYSSQDFEISRMSEYYSRDAFKCRKKLRGGNGTLISPYSVSYYDLKIDRPGTRGLLTLKQ